MSGLRPRMARPNSRAVCPVWNVDMRALKIAGTAIAAVIVVIALLLIDRHPLGLPDLGRSRRGSSAKPATG